MYEMYPYDLGYEGTIWRLPSEAKSLIIQAIIGRSWNACTFCGNCRGRKSRNRGLEKRLFKPEISKSSLVKYIYRHLAPLFTKMHCKSDHYVARVQAHS